MILLPWIATFIGIIDHQSKERGSFCIHRGRAHVDRLAQQSRIASLFRSLMIHESLFRYLLITKTGF